MIPPHVDRRLRRAMRDQAVERMNDEELVYSLLALHEAAALGARNDDPHGFVVEVLDAMTPVIGSVLARFAPDGALEAGLTRYEREEPEALDWISPN